MRGGFRGTVALIDILLVGRGRRPLVGVRWFSSGAGGDLVLGPLAEYMSCVQMTRIVWRYSQCPFVLLMSLIVATVIPIFSILPAVSGHGRPVLDECVRLRVTQYAIVLCTQNIYRLSRTKQENATPFENNFPLQILYSSSSSSSSSSSMPSAASTSNVGAWSTPT